ncbi:MAG TPA: recombinase family protein [Candidatus Saccharimonadales bacterium]|nr:recombinase family protein [Candidatus Saccharimonadales bacterium]
MLSQEQTDLTKLRYVLYARKSTEDENRQVRSIPDQIADCQKLAADLGLRVLDVIQETKSAKKPGKRPLFTQMLRDIENKKYDAILCWHPDRLCRNMLEGGQIINMLDEATLTDIRFHSHQFSNDANGKMLLGMLFVFSKQYSDDLSAKVSRGVEGNLQEGKSAGTPKWGYDRNEATGLYEPNEQFKLVQGAWAKRIQGESLESITAYLVKSGFHRLTKNKQSPRTIKPKVSATGNMFRDPFYYGLLIQANQTVDLRTIYTSFTPMVDEDTFNQVQALSQGRTKDKFTAKRATFYPLHGFVYCAICNSPKHMAVGKNLSGSKEHVLTYRCDTPGCTRKPKSLRAKNVFNSMYAMLEHFELTDDAYRRYSKQIDSMTDDKIIEIKQSAQSRRGALTHIKKELETRALNIGLQDKGSAIYKANEKRIAELSIQIADGEQEIEKLEAKITNPRQIKLGKEEFLNVIKTASVKLKAGSAVEKDVLSRILFLNVEVDNEKVVNYTWKEPFASLVKATELSSGRGDRT